MTEYNLYGSDGCHLCELALAICSTVLHADQFEQIDIVEQERVDHEAKTLVELYGVHIPVLEKLAGNTSKENNAPVDNNKLFWPFTVEQLQAFIV